MSDGLPRPTGANRFIRELPQLLEEKKHRLPVRVRRLALATYEEVRSPEDRIKEIERELEGVIHEVPTLEVL